MNIRTKIFGHSGLGQSPLVSAKRPKGARPDELLSIPVVRQLGRSADTRSDRRFPLVSEAMRVTRRGKTHEVQLLNLCHGGAMIETAFEPKLWERLTLHLGEHGTIDCSVAWIRGRRIGVEFARETRLDCAGDEQGVLIREVIERHFPEVRLKAQASVAMPANDELRDQARHPFIWAGTLHCLNGSVPARLRNISSEGAMIETSVELPAGAEPYLDLGEGGSVFGKVVWSAGDQCGLRFESPFDLAQLAHARPELAAGANSLVRFGSRPR